MTRPQDDRRRKADRAENDARPGTGAERPARVGERIRQELMEMLLRGAIKDPAVAGAIVHAVEVSGDLQHARVFVRLGSLSASEAQRRALLRGLGRASGFLRRELGQRLRVRYTPELRFEWDDTAERATRIESLLEEIRVDEVRASEAREHEPSESGGDE